MKTLIFCFVTALAHAAAATKPNFILILADDPSAAPQRGRDERGKSSTKSNS